MVQKAFRLTIVYSSLDFRGKTTGFPNLKLYFFLRLGLLSRVLVQMTVVLMYLVLDTT